MISKTFNRYIWLLNTLLQQPGLTFDKIKQRWEESTLSQGKPLALRTFHVHREAIKELFGVEIVCDDKYKYRIDTPDELKLKKDHTRQWLLNSFTISNMIEAGHNMKRRILFEDIPMGTEYLQTVIEAMQRSMEIIFHYEQFGSDELKTSVMQPYAMKVYQRRWYIIGYLHEQGAIRTIALDRTKSMEVSTVHYDIPREFDAEKYFKNVVGIYVDEKLEPQRVVLRAYGKHAEYLESLPIHHSQRRTYYKHNEYCEFEYHLCLTPELSTQIMSMGEKVEVIEPAELRESIKERYISALKRYE